MKVKNIVFSGFAAAILAGVSGAHAADPVTPYNLATTEYVAKQAELKQDKLSADNAAAPITISVDESGKATIGADLESTLAPYAKTADVETTLAGYATKDDLDGALDEGGALTEAVNTAVNSAIQEAVTSGEIGDAINNAVADKQDKLTAGTDIEIVTTTDGEGNTVNTINSTVNLAPYATTESVTNITNALDGRVDAIEGAGYQTAGDVTTALAPYAKTETVAETYATKGEIPSLEGLASQTYVQQQAAAVQQAITDAKYVSGKDVAAGTYLITTDGQGTYTWTSVKIVNE